jgi:hypothetical protein
LAVSSVLIYQLSNGRTQQSSAIFQVPSPNEGENIEIAYASSTNLCIDGCKPHQNWIEFYLPSDSYFRDSLRLKTSLSLGQLLTFGIASSRCEHQEKDGYTCVNMEISHRLLAVLTSLNLTPLSQLRDTNNWWLEYIQKQ